MATAIDDTSRAQKPSGRQRRRRTAHLKLVPQARSERDQIRAEAKMIADSLDKSRPLTKDQLELLSRQLLEALQHPDSYLGFVMVCISNEFWRDQVMATDFSRRLLLLPHCLKHAEGCPADYDEFGLDCRRCGACSIADFKVTAEDMGYKVLVAEGTPIVLKIIVSGYVDAVVGVACLNVLEKAIDKILMVGVPSIAVPLLSSDCKNTSVDDDWVSEVIALRQETPKQKTRTYLPMLRYANQLFDDKLDTMAPRVRRKADSEKQTNGHLFRDPIESTEAISYDFLSRGGKRFRPFITLASYDALAGGTNTLVEDESKVEIPDSVSRAAMAIEVFHKASLVHDDIEDDDSYRYGRESLHRKYGIPVGINVGDYLVGMGYRLLACDHAEVGGDCASEVLKQMADAHIKLSEGQGAELIWRESDQDRKVLTPLDALKIYALKTSPAFEAALFSGIRLAGDAAPYREMITSYSRHLGVAFQILNDLKDWEGDSNNKLLAGQDALSARPTLLLALAFEGASSEQRKRLGELLASTENTEQRLNEVRRIFESAQAFEKAEALVEKYRARAEGVADDVEPIELRELLYFLVDTVLDNDPPEPKPTMLHNLPIVQQG